MARQDVAIWRRFLRHDHPQIVSVAYDVRVGQERVLPDNTEPEFVSMWATLTKKRVDAVVETPLQLWIIEVKPVASMAALGQALTYALLYRREFAAKKPVVPVVVCDHLDVDLPPVYKTLGVGVVEMGFAGEDKTEPLRVWSGRPVPLLGAS